MQNNKIVTTVQSTSKKNEWNKNNKKQRVRYQRRKLQVARMFFFRNQPCGLEGSLSKFIPVCYFMDDEPWQSLPPKNLAKNLSLSIRSVHLLYLFILDPSLGKFLKIYVREIGLVQGSKSTNTMSRARTALWLLRPGFNSQTGYLWMRLGESGWFALVRPDPLVFWRNTWHSQGI